MRAAVGSGRPQGALNRATEIQRATLSELARDHTEAAVATLADVMQNGSSESARIAAANAILDRGYGKAWLGQSDKLDQRVSGGEGGPLRITKVETVLIGMDGVERPVVRSNGRKD